MRNTSKLALIALSPPIGIASLAKGKMNRATLFTVSAVLTAALATGIGYEPQVRRDIDPLLYEVSRPAPSATALSFLTPFAYLLNREVTYGIEADRSDLESLDSFACAPPEVPIKPECITPNIYFMNDPLIRFNDSTGRYEVAFNEHTPFSKSRAKLDSLDDSRQNYEASLNGLSPTEKVGFSDPKLNPAKAHYDSKKGEFIELRYRLESAAQRANKKNPRQ